MLAFPVLAAALAGTSGARGATMFVVNVHDQNVYAVDSAGHVSTFATLPNTTSGGLTMAVDGAGNLFVGEAGTGNIDKITPGGTVSPFATLPSGDVVQGLVYSGGNLYASDGGTSQIDQITPGGQVSLYANLAANTFPEGITADTNGNLYVIAGTQTSILKIDTSKQVTTFVSLPQDLLDAHALTFFGGNLYETVDDILDSNATIEKISLNGVPSPFATVSNPLSLPLPVTALGIAADGNGNLYVADETGSEIVKVTADGSTESFFAGVNSATDVIFNSVPEPSTAALLAAAAGSLLLRRRRAAQ